MAFTPFGPVGGLSQFVLVSSGANNACISLVKAGETELMFIMTGNTNAAARYVKFFDLPTAPSVLGAENNTGNPVGQILIPGNSAGAGSNGAFGGSAPYASLQFVQGLVIAVTNDISLASNSGISAGDVSIWLGYK